MLNLIDETGTQDVMTGLAQQIDYVARTMTPETIQTYNEITTNIPEAFRDEIKRSIYGTEFGDVPFMKLTQSLMPKFNEVADDGEDELKEIKNAEHKITDYFKPEENKENEEEIIDEQIQDWTPLLDYDEEK